MSDLLHDFSILDDTYSKDSFGQLYMSCGLVVEDSDTFRSIDENEFCTNWTTDENSISGDELISDIYFVYGNRTTPRDNISYDESSDSLNNIITNYLKNVDHMEGNSLSDYIESQVAEMIASYGDGIIKPIILTSYSSEESILDALGYIVVASSKVVSGRSSYLLQSICENLLDSDKVQLRYSSIIAISYIDDDNSVSKLQKLIGVEKNKYVLALAKDVLQQIE